HDAETWPLTAFPEYSGASFAVPGTGIPFVELGGGGSQVQRPQCWDAGCRGAPQAQAPTESPLNFIAVLALPGADMDPNPRAALERQQLRLRERQKFFEDILQPETEFVFPLSHLHLESHRRSISSMEVNVDTLEQVELIDLGDQDGADVFLPCEDPPPTPQTSGMPLYFGHLGTGVDDRPEEPSLPMPTADRTTSRTFSSSSDSSTNPHSPDVSDGGADTPLAQSDEEEDGGDGGAEPGACS
ncbi:hypothetical protein EI555_011941, partial [Monodon monoceros]